MRVSPFVQARGDAYRVSDLPGTDGSQTYSRALGVTGLDFSYPFFRALKGGTVVLEPLAQIAAGSESRRVPIVVGTSGTTTYLYNEDSTSFEFDETNLFRPDKFPGFDLYEDGARANVGGRASVLWDDGRRASVLIGRSFRDTENQVFSTTSGLTRKASDWVVAADAQPIKGLTLFTRARLDSDSYTLERAEAGANVSLKHGTGYFRYLRDRADPTGAKVENVDLGGEVYLSQHWGVTAYGNRDLAQNAWVIRDLGVVYRDECTRIDVIYRREDVVIGRLGKTESIAIRLTLATLGGPIYAN